MVSPSDEEKYIPEGFCTAAKAAGLLGIKTDEFRLRSQLGILPASEPVIVTYPDGNRLRYYYRESSLERFMPFKKRKKVAATKGVSPAALGMYKRLLAHANRGVVDGDKTDIIHGNPVSERDARDICELADKGYISVGQDNWGRAVYTIGDKRCTGDKGCT